MNKALRETISVNSSENDIQATSLASESTRISSQYSKRRSCRVRYQTRTTSNIFGTFTITSQTNNLQYAGRNEGDIMRDEDPDKDQYEHATTIHIHPSRWLIKLGFGYYLTAAITESSQGLQHSLNTYYAVADDSPIFDFCRTGDIDKVRDLFWNRETCCNFRSAIS